MLPNDKEYVLQVKDTFGGWHLLSSGYCMQG